MARVPREHSATRKDQALPPLRGGPLPLVPRAASLFSLLNVQCASFGSPVESVPQTRDFGALSPARHETSGEVQQGVLGEVLSIQAF